MIHKRKTDHATITSIANGRSGCPKNQLRTARPMLPSHNRPSRVSNRTATRSGSGSKITKYL